MCIAVFVFFFFSFALVILAQLLHVFCLDFEMSFVGVFCPKYTSGCWLSQQTRRTAHSYFKVDFATLQPQEDTLILMEVAIEGDAINALQCPGRRVQMLH